MFSYQHQNGPLLLLPVYRSRLPTDKRRRRKLHGKSCKAVKEQLQGISVVLLANFEETNDPSACLLLLLLLLLLFETLQHSNMSER